MTPIYCLGFLFACPQKLCHSLLLFCRAFLAFAGKRKSFGKRTEKHRPKTSFEEIRFITKEPRLFQSFYENPSLKIDFLTEEMELLEYIPPLEDIQDQDGLSVIILAFEGYYRIHPTKIGPLNQEEDFIKRIRDIFENWYKRARGSMPDPERNQEILKNFKLLQRSSSMDMFFAKNGHDNFKPSMIVLLSFEESEQFFDDLSKQHPTVGLYALEGYDRVAKDIGIERLTLSDRDLRSAQSILIMWRSEQRAGHYFQDECKFYETSDRFPNT